METQQLVELLKMVPETRLRVFSLARELIWPDGTLDKVKGARMVAEIAEARQEASDYGSQTKRLTRALRWLLNLRR